MKRRRTRGRRGSSRRVLGAVAWLLLLLGSLGIVIWRQTRGVALERGLRELQAERAISEAERVQLERRIQMLASRARVVLLARERLGMHLPTDREIVFLAVPPADDAPSRLAAHPRQ
ncbi:MAG: hypothetical protein ACR2H9_12525 [Longimicrobiaceae bacterium]